MAGEWKVPGKIKKMMPLIILVGLLTITAGCFRASDSSSQDKITDEIKKPVPEITQDSENSKDRGQSSDNEIAKDEPAVDNSNAAVPENIEPNTGITSDKHLSWWVNRVKNSAPGIDPGLDKLMQRYNGLYIGNRNKKQVALTFDVGDAGNSSVPQLLDMLAKHNVRANFFVTGQWVEKNPQVFRRIVSEGHLVGNHSYSHPDLTTVSISQVTEQINTTNQIIIDNGGTKPVFFRPPFGYFSETVLNKIYSMGYYTTLWGISMADWLPMSQEQLVYGVVDYLHNGAIALLHVTPDGVKALDRTIPDIKSRGYEIVTLDQLIK